LQDRPLQCKRPSSGETQPADGGQLLTVRAVCSFVNDFHQRFRKEEASSQGAIGTFVQQVYWKKNLQLSLKDKHHSPKDS